VVTEQRLPGGISGLAWAPDSKRIALGADGNVYVYHAESAELLATFEAGTTLSRISVAWSPDGKALAGITTDGNVTTEESVRLWNIETGRQSFQLKQNLGENRGAIAFSPDGAILAAADATGMVGLWDAESGAQIRTCPIHTAQVKSLAWLPDGKTLACGCDDGIRFWNTEPGNPIRTIAGPSPTVFSADGRLEERS